MPQGSMMVVLIVIGLIAMVMMNHVLKHFQMWLQAMLSNVPIPLSYLLGMHFRKVDVEAVVRSHIKNIHAE